MDRGRCRFHERRGGWAEHLKRIKANRSRAGTNLCARTMADSVANRYGSALAIGLRRAKSVPRLAGCARGRDSR